ncbi:MAG: DUF502 domain-containing protein [Firmicutes bacterium]|nr:DUF502 domain-containing protein [Bacillota bacterium]
MLRRLRNLFFAGLLLFVPIIVTINLVWLGFQWLDGFLAELVKTVIGRHIPGLGLLVMVLLIILTGFVATNLLGKRLVAFFERMIRRVPLVGGIYGTIKQITEALTAKEKGVFRSVVLVEYPRQGIYSAGFLVGDPPEELNKDNEKRFVAVFIPTVPNPTSGYLLNYPVDEVRPLDMTVEEALRYFISVGMIRPDRQYQGKPVENNGLPAHENSGSVGQGKTNKL